MNETFTWWLLIAGIGIGIAIAWLVMGRLPRSDEDVSAEERAAEAAWISRAIAAYGGTVSPALVEEILDLHQQYLEGPGVDPRTARPVEATADHSFEQPDADDDVAAVDDPFLATSEDDRQLDDAAATDLGWRDDRDPDAVDPDAVDPDAVRAVDLERDESVRSSR